MNEKSWLDTATAKIRFRPDRRAVRRELEAHLEDLREHTGLTEQAALEAMGDPGRIAEELGRIHRPWLGYLWRDRAGGNGGILLPAGDSGRGRLSASGTAGRRAGKPPGTGPFHGSRRGAGGILRHGCGNRRLYDPGRAGSPAKRRGRPLDPGCGPPDRSGLAEGAPYPAECMVRAGACGQRTAAYSASWLFWQKACIAVEVPEDAEWAELDFGWGERRRTLRIDLTEEAET